MERLRVKSAYNLRDMTRVKKSEILHNIHKSRVTPAEK